MKYIDLFAGCGGLSLGLERAGFKLALAVEKSEMASHTFYHNFIKRIYSDEEWKVYDSSSIENQYKNKLISRELSELLSNDKLIKDLKNQEVDLIAGGPPCQGFSLAGRRNPKDIRNKLPWQFLELVEKIDPKAVIIENVVGMSRAFKKHGEEAPFEQLQIALAETGRGYVVQPIHFNAMHFGVPEHRPRLMILGIRKDVAKTTNITSNGMLWESGFKDVVKEIPDMAPVPTIKSNELRTLRDAISDLSSIEKTQRSKNAISFLKEMKDPKIWKLKPLQEDYAPNQSKRNHQDKAVMRFRLYQYLASQDLASSTLNIPAKYNEGTARKMLQELLIKSDMPAMSPDGTKLANNTKELIALIFELKTKKHSQRPLSWDKPSPTVVTLPDDYVHPSEPRIFTVRELARMQSFPDDFEFKSKETTGSKRRRFEVPQYSQVGNAVAPLAAYAVGKRFYEILSKYEAANPKRTQ
jgi:DNA (cytosine-5)-methyltransferase 1